jgi:hypothetical protein
MEFKPPSREARITVVTSTCTQSVLSFRRKCDYEIEQTAPGRKCRPGRYLHSLEVTDPGASEGRDGSSFRRLRACPAVSSNKVFHRPGLQLAGVKCELVTEVRPLR